MTQSLMPFLRHACHGSKIGGYCVHIRSEKICMATPHSRGYTI